MMEAMVLAACACLQAFLVAVNIYMAMTYATHPALNWAAAAFCFCLFLFTTSLMALNLLTTRRVR